MKNKEKANKIHNEKGLTEEKIKPKKSVAPIL